MPRTKQYFNSENVPLVVKPNGHYIPPPYALQEYDTPTLFKWLRQICQPGTTIPTTRNEALQMLQLILDTPKLDQCGPLDTIPWMIIPVFDHTNFNKQAVIRAFGDNSEYKSIFNDTANTRTPQRYQSKLMNKKKAKDHPEFLKIWNKLSSHAKSFNPDFEIALCRMLLSVEGCKRQLPHMDPQSYQAHDDKCPVVSVILAIEDNTSLVFRKKRDVFQTVEIPVGSAIVFRSDRVHCGAELSRGEHRRIFCMWKRKLHLLERDAVHILYECKEEWCNFECFSEDVLKRHKQKEHFLD